MIQFLTFVFPSVLTLLNIIIALTGRSEIYTLTLDQVNKNKT